MTNKSLMTNGNCPVNSHNEWDPLEEVIVGSVDGARFAGWKAINRVVADPGVWDEAGAKLGDGTSPYPKEIMQAANAALDRLVHILEAEGVTVRHVASENYGAPFATPAWHMNGGFSAANPRDPFLIIGNEIIETPMADRSRYFEAFAYRPLFKEYFKAGAKWTSAPKPQLLDALIDADYTIPTYDEPMRYVITEFEPVFDAADFVRCGRDIFCQESNVTNKFGIEWLQRHLGDEYRIHTLSSLSPQAVHIDTSFMPLAPGKVLVSPDFLDVNNLPDILKTWDVLVPPPPVPHTTSFGVVSDWIGINLLMLDEERVIVEKKQTPLIKALKEWGFKPIPIDFEAYYPFLGGIHCATLDVRRRGELQSYF